MSVVNRRGEKIDLDRSGVDPYWERLLEDFAGDNDLRLKYLAVLALRENSGWKLEDIGRVFDHPKGHVSRIITRAKKMIRDRFSLDAEGRLVDRATTEAV